MSRQRRMASFGRYMPTAPIPELLSLSGSARRVAASAAPLHRPRLEQSLAWRRRVRLRRAVCPLTLPPDGERRWCNGQRNEGCCPPRRLGGDGSVAPPTRAWQLPGARETVTLPGVFFGRPRKAKASLDSGLAPFGWAQLPAGSMCARPCCMSAPEKDAGAGFRFLTQQDFIPKADRNGAS